MKRITFLSVLWLFSMNAYSHHAAPNDTLVGLILNKSGEAIKNVLVSAHGHPEARRNLPVRHPIIWLVK